MFYGRDFKGFIEDVRRKAQELDDSLKKVLKLKNLSTQLLYVGGRFKHI